VPPEIAGVTAAPGARDSAPSAPHPDEPPATDSGAPTQAARPALPALPAPPPAPPATSTGRELSLPRPPLAARRMRRRLARLAAPKLGADHPAVLDPLLATLRRLHPKADLRPVVRAYEMAELAHRGQQRRSGDPYITHPLAVSVILAELGMDTDTVCAALLHDVVEDTRVRLDEVRQEFGELVATVVDGVTKLDKVHYGDAAQAETVRKMVVAMSREPRVLLVKLADRLHNMRTLRWLPEAKQEKKARETLEIFAPLAHRLGLNTLKWELEDLAFATLYPKRYDEIVRLVAERAPSRDTYLAQVIEQVDNDLKAAGIPATVTGRPKHYYSIYQKMVVRGRDFTDIYDLIGLRIVVDDVRACYATLGTLHATWNPVPGRFKDYIAMPKYNMYQSLHTTVIGPGGKPVELQIRTTAMHKIAEYGIAAHWMYKESKNKVSTVGVAGAGATDPQRPGGEMAWLKQIVDWQRETADPAEFLDALRFELHSAETYVFTPKGEVITLPAGATPVDFAYAVHTEVGHRCIGARVNGRLVPLESTLDHGDVVEIFTSKAATAAPSRDWLTFATSNRAKSKIRQWFAKERREDAIEEGKDAIARAVRKAGLPLARLLSGDSLSMLAGELHYSDISSLYAAVGEGHVQASTVVQRLLQALGGRDAAAEDVAENEIVHRQRPDRTADPADPGVLVRGVSDVWVKLARCCTPVPGDAITGFVTRGHGVSVHRADCQNVDALRATPEGAARMVTVEWAPSSASMFLVAIQVEALDRTRLLSDVTRVLSDHHVNILSASVTTTRDRVAVSRFTFEMGSTEHLGHLVRQVRQVEGVYDCYRVVSGKS
jgi:guanosine-3',5'-bis(diphosphate) 3'-pyrophosphohydrolase